MLHQTLQHAVEVGNIDSLPADSDRPTLPIGTENPHLKLLLGKVLAHSILDAVGLGRDP